MVVNVFMFRFIARPFNKLDLSIIIASSPFGYFFPKDLFVKYENKALCLRRRSTIYNNDVYA